jgi:hypothetical protein
MVREDQRTPPRVRTHPHPIHFAGAAGWATFVAIVATLLIRHNDLARSTDWSIVAGAVLLAASGLVGPALRWLRTWVELDASVARCTSGVVRPSTVDVDLEHAQALAIDQSMAGRWLGYGRLRVVDATGTTHVFPPIGEAALRAAMARGERRARTRRGDRRDA